MLLKYRFSDFETFFFCLYVPQLYFLTGSPVIMNLVMNAMKKKHKCCPYNVSVETSQWHSQFLLKRDGGQR